MRARIAAGQLGKSAVFPLEPLLLLVPQGAGKLLLLPPLLLPDGARRVRFLGPGRGMRFPAVLAAFSHPGAVLRRAGGVGRSQNSRLSALAGKQGCLRRGALQGLSASALLLPFMHSDCRRRPRVFQAEDRLPDQADGEDPAPAAGEARHEAG